MTQAELGYAKVRKEYDPIGNLTREFYFDVHIKPAVHKERGYASFQDTYENGLRKECRYSDEDGKLILRDDRGVCHYKI